MKKNRRLIKMVQILVKESFTNGKLNNKKVIDVIKLLKKLPLAQSIFVLSEFLKGIQRQRAQYLLMIESSTALSKSEVDKITRTIRKQYLFSEVKNVVNPSLIGGIRLRIGDDIFDHSLRGRIIQLGGIIHG